MGSAGPSASSALNNPENVPFPLLARTTLHLPFPRISYSRYQSLSNKGGAKQVISLRGMAAWNVWTKQEDIFSVILSLSLSLFAFFVYREFLLLFWPALEEGKSPTRPGGLEGEESTSRPRGAMISTSNLHSSLCTMLHLMANLPSGSWFILSHSMKKPRLLPQPVFPAAVRRSSRVADKPPPSYRVVSFLIIDSTTNLKVDLAPDK